MSCQDVCLWSDYDNGPDFYREATRKAGKRHRCCECREMIEVGESHHYASGKWDGDFGDFRTCAVCVEIRLTFACKGFVFEQLWEDIREQIFSEWNEMTQIDCLARLKTDAAIAKMRAKFVEYQEAA